MKLIIFFKSAAIEAHALAIFSVLLFLAKIFYCNKQPEIFSGAHELGLFVDGVLGSVFASYVFYLFAVHMKELKDKTTVQPYIEKHARSVVVRCIQQLSTISNSTQTELTLQNVNSESLEQAFLKIVPQSSSGALLSISPKYQYANWLQYFEISMRNTHASINKLFDQLLFLDVKLVSLLTDIDDCIHFKTISNLPPAEQLANIDLRPWKSGFLSYCESCRALKTYLDTNKL